MRRNYLIVAVAAGLVLSGAASARDNFKNASAAYSAGLYNSAAHHWMTLANEGHAPAQYNVGRMLYYGQGKRRDTIEAYKWFLLASENGIRRSAKAVRIASERMTRPEIVEATIRARDWHRRKTRDPKQEKGGPHRTRP